MSNGTDSERPRIAFYAPMKPASHPTPSGDREIARLTLKALRGAGFDPQVASELRVLDVRGSDAVQGDLERQAGDAVDRICEAHRDAPPCLWFTYHCHYKAPDLVGPTVSDALGIPYVISEPSISAKRREGPWAAFARRSEDAIARADRLFWTTARDRPALEAAGQAGKMVHLPAFTELPPQAPRADLAVGQPLRLLTIAMMREGDKVESYRRLAAALPHVQPDWRLSIVGDGAARAEVQALFSPFGDRVTLLGQIDDPTRLQQAFAEADLFAWPGVGEGVGMVYLEAQAAGLPVVAEDHPAQRDVISDACVTPGDASAFGSALSLLADPDAYRLASTRARAHVEARHSLASASRLLRNALNPLVQ